MYSPYYINSILKVTEDERSPNFSVFEILATL